MAIFNIGNKMIYDIDSSPEFGLGEILLTSTSEGSKKYVYIKYRKGAGSVTCHANQVIVPMSNSTTADLIKLTTYTADITDTTLSACRLAGIAQGKFTNLTYGWIQRQGYARCEQGTTIYRAEYGNSLIAGMADKQVYVFPVQSSVTDGDANLLHIRHTQAVFATALVDGAATTVAAELEIYLHGAGT